jgi:aminoglycoside phosphotransferase (APT) family kinase protein
MGGDSGDVLERGEPKWDVADAGRGVSVSPRDLRMFAAIRHALKTTVAAEVSSEIARTYCDFSIAFLDRFITKHTEWPGILQRQTARQMAVLKRAAELLASVGAAHADVSGEVGPILRSLEQRQACTLENIERCQRQVDGLLERVLPALLRASRMRHPDRVPLVNDLLRELVASIRDSERELNEAMAARAERHEALVNSKAMVTRERLQAYLRERFPERSALEIESFTELPGGSSKTTIFIDVRGFEHDGVTPLVVRLDREAGSTDTRIINEVPTLRTVAAQGLPVPEIVLVEPDPSKVGLAFIIVRKMDGLLGGGMWHADQQLCNADTARDLARILARMHTLDVEALGLRGALNSDPKEHPMRGLINNIRGLLSQKKMDPDGTLEACLWWLEEHMPPAPRRPSLIHADVSFHNILVRDKQIVGLLDWELSHLGDPIEDLSYARLCIEQLIPWDDFLAEYRRHGGGEYDEETGRYYGIWRGVRNLVYTITAQHSFQTDANPDMRWGFFANYYRLVLLEAAEKVAASGVRPSVV